ARGGRPLLRPRLPRRGGPLRPPGRRQHPRPRGRRPPRERRPGRRGPHPEHHPRHEPRRRGHRLARRRRGGLDLNRTPRMPHAAARRRPPLRRKGQPRPDPGNAGEGRGGPDPAHPARGALPRGLDQRRGAAARGDLRPGPSPGHPHPRRRRPVRREHPRGHPGNRRGHVRLHRAQVGARPGGHGRVLRQAGPPGPQSQRRIPLAPRPRGLRQRGRLRAQGRRQALRGLDHERRARRGLRGGSPGRSGARRGRLRGDPSHGGPLDGPVVRASARQPALAEAGAKRARQLRDRGGRGQGGRRAAAPPEVRPAFRPSREALRPGQHAPLQHGRRTGGVGEGRRGTPAGRL
ncbi:MAG: Cysteine desulfurase, partial [uncultured Rubrobacteraceae bacterium]